MKCHVSVIIILTRAEVTKAVDVVVIYKPTGVSTLIPSSAVIPQSKHKYNVGGGGGAELSPQHQIFLKALGNDSVFHL